MAEIKKINAGPALTVPLALAQRGCHFVTTGLEKGAVSQKFTADKEHAVVAKITAKSDMIWAFLGLALLFHGAQFKNLFLCTQVIVTFCYDRMKNSTVSVYDDVKVALEKLKGDETDESKADAKAEAKPDNKHAQKRAGAKDDAKPAAERHEEDAAATKKLLKVLDSEKVTSAVFEIFVAYMACHMITRGGLAQVVFVTHALVKASKEKLVAFLEFPGHEDMQVWIDLCMSFLLYTFFGGMAVVLSPLALALILALCGAQLVTQHGVRVAESMGRIPEGTAETFAASAKGLAFFGGLTAFGTLWQVWALMAGSGMAWYSKLAYLPACLGEGIVSLF